MCAPDLLHRELYMQMNFYLLGYPDQSGVHQTAYAESV
jgi:hypothetical protein